LLRRQLEFPLQKQNEFLISKIPKGLNWNDCFLLIGDQFVSKVKDVAIAKGVKEADKESNVFFIKVSHLEENLNFDNKVQINEGILVYSPWFRFIKEPFDFLDREVNSKYIMKTLLYIARQNKIEAELRNDEHENESLIFVNKFKGADRLEIEFEKSLEKLSLVGTKGSSILDFRNQKITLFADHDKVLFNALSHSEDRCFKNLILKKTDETIEMVKAHD